MHMKSDEILTSDINVEPNPRNRRNILYMVEDPSRHCFDILLEILSGLQSLEYDAFRQRHRRTDPKLSGKKKNLKQEKFSRREKSKENEQFVWL